MYPHNNILHTIYIQLFILLYVYSVRFHYLRASIVTRVAVKSECPHKHNARHLQALCIIGGEYDRATLNILLLCT